MRFSKSRRNIIKKATTDARRIKMEAIADTRADLEKIKHDAEQEIFEQLNNLEIAKSDFSRKRETFFRDLERLGFREEQLTESEKANLQLQRELTKKISEVNNKMAGIANMSLDQIKSSIMDNVQLELAAEINLKKEAAKLEATKNAQDIATNILISAMEKSSIDLVTSSSITKVTIPNQEMKGKIIGKEGRNIRAFEQYGGVDLVIDDTPNSISISSFNPIRREIAARALEELIDDGRIQPVRIEEALIESEKKLNTIIEQTGNDAVNELEIYDLPEEIKFLVGKLKYRTSYNQNVLKHSMEVAKISAIIAAELKQDSYLALKAGLLHDIGKAVDYEQEGSHVALGVQILKKANLDKIIINAVESHHDDVKKESIIAEIISIADSLSAARPGARNNNVADFFVRMDEIEQLIKSFNGVKNAYVLRSGRQIRIIVDPELIDDAKLAEISQKITDAIAKNNKVPGEIVITIIREQRLTSKINSLVD
jgi:ribonuclease Y